MIIKNQDNLIKKIVETKENNTEKSLSLLN